MKRTCSRLAVILFVFVWVASGAWAAGLSAQPDRRFSAQMPRFAQDIKLDGDLTEWRNIPSVPVRCRSHISRLDYRHQWNGPADAGAEFYCAWTAKGVYLAAQVADDDVQVAATPGDTWTRDCVQFFIDGRAPNQLGEASETPVISQILVRPPTAKSAVAMQSGDVAVLGVRVAGKRTKSGYNIEVFVPWKALPYGQATPGRHLGVGFALNEYDGRDGTMIGPLQMTYMGRQSLSKTPSNLIRWTLVNKVEFGPGAALGPFVSVEAGHAAPGSVGLPVSVQVGPALAAKARFVRLSCARSDGKKVPSTRSELLRDATPWNGSRIGCVRLPLDTSLPGSYMVAATLTDAKGRILGRASGRFATDGQMYCAARSVAQTKYLLYLPQGYDKDKSARWPMVVFLHGLGAGGQDLGRVADIGLAKMVAEGKQFPFILVSPQCPGHSRWNDVADDVLMMLDSVEAKYRVDRSRIYLTGLSMGGFGTWALAIRDPHRFAAAAPLCGGGDPSLAFKAKDVPMWVFHGDQDKVVPPQRSQEMVDAIKKAGGNPKFTLYPGVDHNCWDRTYGNPEFWKWLLAQKKK